MHIPTSSFLRPLMRGPKRPLKVFMANWLPRLVILGLAAMPVSLFWIAYRDSGAMPWDAGLLGFPLVSGSLVLPTRAEVIIGLAWALAIPVAGLVVWDVALSVLARFDRALTGAGAAAFGAVLAAVSFLPLQGVIANAGATSVAIAAAKAEYARARAGFVERGMAQEAKILDVQYEKGLRAMLRLD